VEITYLFCGKNPLYRLNIIFRTTQFGQALLILGKIVIAYQYRVSLSATHFVYPHSRYNTVIYANKLNPMPFAMLIIAIQAKFRPIGN
jgi:hypothetical protein